jgi:hypothetical protein
MHDDHSNLLPCPFGAQHAAPLQSRGIFQEIDNREFLAVVLHSFTH